MQSSATALVILTPATVVQSQGGGGENLPIFSVGGGGMRNQQFNLDGGNVTNVVGLAVPQQQTRLPMEAMQEFRILSNNYTAELGHSAGGVILLSTRAGTNRFRGSVFEYARNEAFDARNFFASSRPKFRQNQFGAALNGRCRSPAAIPNRPCPRPRSALGSSAAPSTPPAASSPSLTRYRKTSSRSGPIPTSPAQSPVPTTSR